MNSQRYSEEELSLLRSLFETADAENIDFILINQLPGLLVKLGKNNDEIINITEAASKIAQENEGRISFEDFTTLIENAENASESMAPFEGPDPKVIEFCRILEEYRVKCEEDGNYLEAARALKQLGVLRKQEEKRQQKAIRARQISERQDVQLAHNMQYSDFNQNWDKYMEDYDNMAQMYIQQMTERHALILLEYQKQLRQELLSKPPKWSKQLLDWRKRQHILARRKNYAEAQKIKRIADQAEEKEKQDMEQAQAVIFARKEAKFRQQQQAELQALLKRIEVRRKEHIKQRNIDSKRLLQRNRNVQSVLESKQTVEANKLNADMKKNILTTSNKPVRQTMTNSRSLTSSNIAPGKGNSSLPRNDQQDGEEGDGEDLLNYYDNEGNTYEDQYGNDNGEYEDGDELSFLKDDGPMFSNADGKDD